MRVKQLNDKDMNISELNLTELESKVLEAYLPMLYAEPGFSDVDVNDLSKALGISNKILRGVVGSLSKKGIVDLDDNGEYVIIYLMEKYWYLKGEEWANEAHS